MYTQRSIFTILLACFALSLPSSALLNQAIDEFTFVNIGRGLPQYHDTTLLKRDICSDTFPGTVVQYCTPGQTLCCVPKNNATAWPQCQVKFGSGYCCVEENGNCYIDYADPEPRPSCTAPGAVQCNALAPGVTEACCPQFNRCPPTFNQTLMDTRCEFANPTTSFSIASTTSATSTSTSSSSFTSHTTATPSVSDQNSTIAVSSSSGLSTGAAAGIGVVSGLAVLCMVAVGVFIYRRGKKKGMLLPNAYSKATVSPYPDTLAVASYARLDSDRGKLTPPPQIWSRSPSRSRTRSELPVEHFELLELPTGGSHEVPELPAYESHG